MQARLSLPVHVENDANLGALAELTWGAGRDCAHLVYLKVSNGIGAGLIVAGRLFRGAGGTAGEIGHTILDETGDSAAAATAAAWRPTPPGRRSSSAPPQPRRGPHARNRARARRRGRGGCRRAIADAGATSAPPRRTLQRLNPQRIVVGGSIGTPGRLLEPMREAGGALRIHTAAADVEIVPSELATGPSCSRAGLVLHGADPIATPIRAVEARAR
jgi:predicted NBD/HSP70 family sugar kinase